MVSRFSNYCVAYLLLAIVTGILIHGDASQTIGKLGYHMLAFANLVDLWLVILTVAAFVIVVFVVGKNGWSHMLAALRIWLACTIFLGSYMIFKTALPYAVDAVGAPVFWADAPLIDIDEFIHFGTTPWEIVFSIGDTLGSRFEAPLISFVYGKLWALPSFYLPVFVYLLEGERELTNRILNLYLITWIVLGNIVAVVFLAAGPVFNDQIHGVLEFQGLRDRLAEADIGSTWIGAYQEFLLKDYFSNRQMHGTGISAFPSLHLGMAALTFVYLAEKSKFLGWLGMVWILVTLYGSIWTGYHYAIDGYAAILFVIAGNWLLKKYPSTVG